MRRRRVSRSGLCALRGAARIEILENRQMLAAPDLTAAIVSLDTIVARGHQMTVDFRITNNGTAPTAQTWSDGIWMSPVSTFDPTTATDIGSWWNGDVSTLPLTPAPGPGSSYETSRSATVPTALATGTWYVFVEADRWNGPGHGDCSRYRDDQRHDHEPVEPLQRHLGPDDRRKFHSHQQNRRPAGRLLVRFRGRFQGQ
ncbi:MAG: hypothetical protein ABSH20_04315 [Tepidisphaeraceae bacterium]